MTSKQEQHEIISQLMSLPNVKEVTANLLYGEGYQNLEDIAFSDQENLVKAGGLKDQDEAERIQTAARLALKDRLEQMSYAESSVPEEVQKEEMPAAPGETQPATETAELPEQE